MSKPFDNKPSGTKPFTIRLTDAERSELERRAGEMALGTFIKVVLFCDGEKKSRRGARKPVKDHIMLAQLLASLGSSRLGESMEMLAKAAENGTLYVDDSVPREVKKACQDIAVMRIMLMQALGFRVQADGDGPKESLRQSFTRHARTRDW